MKIDGEDQDVALKILHTADWHLGQSFPGFEAEDQPKLTQARIEAVDKLLGLAESHAVDAVLCAGDLFDEPAPQEQWWRELLKLFGRRKWTQRPVFLLPGNHDPLRPNSVWAADHPFRRSLPAWVHVVDRDDFEFAISQDAVLYAVPCRSRAGADDPTSRIPQRTPGDSRIRIGLAHGTTFDAKGHQMNFPVARNAAEQRGLDYLALGDTHGFREYPPKIAPTVYPGTPEPTTFDEMDAGSAAIIFFPRHRRMPLIHKERVARWKWMDKRCSSMEELEDLRGQDLKDCVLRLTLAMEVSVSERARVDEILEELKGNEARVGRAGVLCENLDELQVSVRDAGDFHRDLPDVLNAAIANLRSRGEQAGEDGETAREALVLLYKTLAEERSQTAGAPHARSGGAGQ
ncbi:MAG TPA: metallophosphoesterase [Bryobacteraceae bacterium]